MGVGAGECGRAQQPSHSPTDRDSDQGRARSPLRLDRFHHDRDTIDVSRFVGGNRVVTWLAATCAFAIIGCTWAMATARYGGPDEPAHIIRAAAVSHGDLLGDAVRRLEPGYRQVSVPAPLATGDPGCFRHDEAATAACATV